MTFLLTAYFTLLSPLPAQAALATGTLSCKAVFRTVVDEKAIEKVADMPIAFSLNGVVKYQQDLEGRFFSLTEDAEPATLLGQISRGPDYTSGSVARGSVDAFGRFNVTEVNGVTVYRMECQKLPLVQPPRLHL